MLIINSKNESLDYILSVINEARKIFPDAVRDAETVKALVAKTAIKDYLYDESTGEGNPEYLFKFKKADQFKLQVVVGSSKSPRATPEEVIRIFKKSRIKYPENIAELMDRREEFLITIKGNEIICRPSTSTRVVSSTDSTNYNESATLLAIMNKYTKESYADKLSQLMAETYGISSDIINSKNFKTYISSAIKSASCFYKKFKSFKADSYYGERQKQGESSKAIYKQAKALGAPSNKDNWNPADIWFIKKSFKLNKLLAIDSLSAFNAAIKDELNSNIIPVSLKLVTTDKATIDLIDGSATDAPIKADKSLKITGIHLGVRAGTDISNSAEVELSNGRIIHMHSRGSNTSDTCNYQLPYKGNGKVGTNSGIDKSIVIKYVYKDSSFNSTQRSFYDRTKSNITKMNKIIDHLYSMGGNLIDVSKADLKKMYINAKEGVELNRFVMIVLNLEALLESMNDIVDGVTVLQKLFLSGLKADSSSGQCAHYKIH